MVDAKRTIEAIWRIESAHLIIALTRLLGDVGRAEEIAQDTFVTALEHWPVSGVPPNPGAWLMTAARNKAIDFMRREKTREGKYALARRPRVGRERPGGPDSSQHQRRGPAVAALHRVSPCAHPGVTSGTHPAAALRAYDRGNRPGVSRPGGHPRPEGVAS